MLPIDALAVANYFLDVAESAGEKLTPMKVQKLVYYAHGWHLGLTGTPLLDELVQAWSFGPVVRSVYNEFKAFGSGEITERACTYVADAYTPRIIHARVLSIDDASGEDKEFIRGLLKRIWDLYGKFTAIQLSNLTHALGTPWRRVWDEYKGQIPRYAIIPNDWIKEYFENQRRRA